MTRIRLVFLCSAVAFLLLLLVLFVWGEREPSQVPSVEAEAVLHEDTIELTADFSQVKDIEDAVLYLYTPHAAYSLGDTTAETPIFGNDVRKEVLKEYIVSESQTDRDTVGTFLSTGITHAGEGKTMFHLLRKMGSEETEKFRLFLITTEHGWFQDEYQVDELAVVSPAI